MCVLSKVIMVSERLKDVFIEMDTSCDVITFSITAHVFGLSTSGSAGYSTSEVCPCLDNYIEVINCDHLQSYVIRTIFLNFV